MSNVDPARTQQVLTAEGWWWRDDPSRFPRTTWHAVKSDNRSMTAACGFGPVGHRRTVNTSDKIACPDCVALVNPVLVTELHLNAKGELVP